MTHGPTGAHAWDAGTTRGAVVVVNYSSSALLQKNLVPLSQPGGPAVVVVDNESTPSERTSVSELAVRHGWEVVAAENRGYGAGMNVGVARAAALGCTAFLLLNPDVRIDIATATELLRHVQRHPMSLVTPDVAHPSGAPSFSCGSLDLRTGELRTRAPVAEHLRWLSGACLGVSSTLWQALGGMDERFFMYWEDIDLSRRCLTAGGDLEVRRDLRVFHEPGGTQGAGKSPLYIYYNCRNRLVFAGMHVPPRSTLRWVASAPLYAWRVAGRNGRRMIVTAPARTALPAIRGTVAGIGLGLAAAVTRARRRRHGGRASRA